MTQQSSPHARMTPLTQPRTRLSETLQHGAVLCTMGYSRGIQNVYAGQTTLGAADTLRLPTPRAGDDSGTGIQGVAGSNPVSPTSSKAGFSGCLSSSTGLYAFHARV